MTVVAPRTWLVGVDLQRVFADPDSPWATPGFATALAGTQRLRPVADRVCLTRFVAPATPTGAWREYYEQWPFALVGPDDSIYDLVDDLEIEGDAVVSATTFGKWAELAPLVGEDDTVVLTGVSTDCCVLSTALAAADAGVPVYVAADACAGLSPADHQRALDAMALYAPLITIGTVEHLLSMH